MTYTPESDPRYLGLSQEEVREDEAVANLERAEIEQRIQNQREIEDVLRQPGWKQMEALLTEKIQAAQKYILTGGAKTMEEVAQARGTIQAAEILLNLPEDTRTNLETLQQDLEELQELQTAAPE